MVFNIPSVAIDDTIVAKNIRANVNTFTRQSRIKLVLTGIRDKPVDLILSSVSKPTMEKMVAKINISGQEAETMVEFKVSIGYSVFKSQWHVNGVIGLSKVSETLNSFGDLFRIIKKYF